MTDPILAAIDTETTGLLTPDHRIVEVHIGFYQNRKKVFDYEQRIDPQRGMPAEAQRVHGISSSDLMGMPTWETVGPTVYKVLSRAQAYIWHNGDEFDGPFIDMEMKRIGLPGIPERPALDTMLNGVWATHDGKKPRLEELCFACGVTYDKSLAHAASYDTGVMMECLFKGVDMGFFALPDLQQAALAA
jgi:DNA polymerase III subunit epsilon